MPKCSDKHANGVQESKVFDEITNWVMLNHLKRHSTSFIMSDANKATLICCILPFRWEKSKISTTYSMASRN